MSCESCTDAARERMRGLDDIKQKAKANAEETGQMVAICKDGEGEYFLAPASEAVKLGNIIVEIIS